MITVEKIKQIQKKIKSGIPEGEVKNDLIREGFSEDDIKEAFKPKHYDMRSWYLFFAIIISLFALYQLIVHQRLLFVGLSIAMFIAYFSEIKRVAKQNND
jgi:hypothetical protein